MNKHIAELAELAAQEGALLENETNLEVFVDDEVTYYIPATFIEKFAELIVRECIRIDVGNPDAAPGIEIAKHFGVEE